METKELNTELMELVNQKHENGAGKRTVFGKWIPFRGEESPEGTIILAEPLPEDGQQIIIRVCLPEHEEVQADTFVNDGGECRLESGYRLITDADFWMPFPAPPKK